LDLGVDPIHDPAAADIDSKGAGACANSILKLSLPGFTGTEVVLIEPDLETRRLRFRGGKETAFEGASRVGVDTGVTEEEQWWICHRHGRDRIQIMTFRKWAVNGRNPDFSNSCTVENPNICGRN
jgi:hypothetical protein